MQSVDNEKFARLEEIQEELRDLYEGRAQDASYALRHLAMAGEEGSRCLTFHLEARASYFDSARGFLDDLVARVRDDGFTVDELLQRVPEGTHDVRFWLLIYETGSHDAFGRD